MDEAQLSRTITIRNMPEQLERRIETMAADEGASLAQTVIRLLLRATGLGGSGDSGGAGRGRSHELDALAGTWSADDAAEFDASLQELRRTDPELWG
jgi:plasmid stability protein